MITPWEFLADLQNPALAFLPKALLISVLSAALCAVVGTHMVLRGMAFAGDAIAHAVFPGLAIAFVLGGSLVLGGLIGGLSVALLVALFAHKSALKEDSLIGVFFAAAFAIGLVVLSRTQAYAGSLEGFLSGSITGVSAQQLWMAAIAAVVIVALLAAIHRELAFASLDRELARAAGVPVVVLDVLLYTAVAVSVVVAVHTVGNILVLALLITPASTARLLCRRLLPMMLCAMLLGIAASILGIYAAWSLDIPAGASIVLCSTVMFFFVWLLQPLLKDR
ncbi:anchored repeat-type ABC transporter permease subunit [Corynebacterium pseudopelargi]|uniref:Manganese transport system membrane protein MntB n=1 Tax=Corynebacterium pseudopelargi TaxID=2080757 RepID=A0A3G6IUX1_9CORY|nr:anchored repeat-type ABC transporter permease subunit [Corynebacterium pseudopelargi]AZA08408.1 Manganese transport system membrane protein MntB [Corynebacterium pseudopelargi]